MIKQGRSQRTQAEDIIYPMNGVREEMKRRGIKPKDYHRDNLKNLKTKKMEYIKKQKDMVESKKESNWKLNKFKNVESLALKDPKQIEELKKAKAKQERKKTETKLEESKEKNYVKENAIKAQSSPAKKPIEKSQDNVYSLNPHFGKVPK